MRRWNMMLWLVLIACFGNSATLNAQSVLPVGYVLSAMTDGIQLNPIDSKGADVSTAVMLEGFAISEESHQGWRITEPTTIALSPSRELLAFTATNDEVNLTLFLYNVQNGMLQRYPLSVSTDAYLQLIWSPDSTALLLTPVVTDPSDTRVFNLATAQFTTVIQSWNVALKWLPNSQNFIYIGPESCTSGCFADNDLHIGDRSGLNNTALTRLDAGQMELTDKLTSPDIGVAHITWSESQQRIYFVVGEPITIDSIQQIYSVDLVGNMRFEVDIAAVYSDSVLTTDVTRILPDMVDGTITIVTETQGVDGVPWRWSILRYDPHNQTTTIIYEQDFEDSSGLRFLVDLKMSSDNRYLALSGTDSARGYFGLVLVIDLQTGSLVATIDNIAPACNVEWTDDSTLLYSQAETTGRCYGFVSNQPAASLHWYDLATGITRTRDAEGAPLVYLLPGR